MGSPPIGPSERILYADSPHGGALHGALAPPSRKGALPLPPEIPPPEPRWRRPRPCGLSGWGQRGTESGGCGDREGTARVVALGCGGFVGTLDGGTGAWGAGTAWVESEAVGCGDTLGTRGGGTGRWGVGTPWGQRWWWQCDVGHGDTCGALLVALGRGVWGHHRLGFRCGGTGRWGVGTHRGWGLWDVGTPWGQ